MNSEKLILVSSLSTHYNIEMDFFIHLSEVNRITITTINESQYIEEDTVFEIEKMIRMHQELNVNPEGIDIVFNLLEKMNHLENELNSIKNKLRLYED